MPRLRLHLGLLRLPADLGGSLVLAPEEDARLARIAAPARAAQYKAGRWLLRRLAGLAAGVPWEAVALNAEGRPRASLPSGSPPPPFLSLAHSGEWVLGAACSAPCGVDIERLGLGRDWKALALHEGLPEGAGEVEFLRHWTLKEARFKAPEPAAGSVRRFETGDYLACLASPSDVEVETPFWSGPPLQLSGNPLPLLPSPPC